MDRVRDRDGVSGRVTDRVRVRRPDSSANLLIRRKMDYAPVIHGLRSFFKNPIILDLSDEIDTVR